MENVDEKIEIRWRLRQSRQFKEADILRDELDSELVFIFDHKDYQEIHYLTDSYFRKMPPEFKTKRAFVEHRMRKDRQAESNLNAWIFSNKPKYKF